MALSDALDEQVWSSCRAHRNPPGAAPPNLGRDGLQEAAQCLAGLVRWAGPSHLRERRWDLVARTELFDAWLIGWPPGGTVDLHDHGRSSGVVLVLEGTLVETTPVRSHDGGLRLVRRVLGAGDSGLSFSAGHVHDVTNEGERHAVSLHVYGPPLTTMTFFDIAETVLRPRGTGWVGGETEAGPTIAS